MQRVAVLFLALVCLSGSIAQGQQNAVQIKGIKDKITIYRDERGIPYIEAKNDEDLYFAQGYVTAGDRLWQMDLMRRTERGELAEILGSLYFLNPLCKPGGADWREQLSDLVRLDQPDEDRQQRLYGAFNSGYTAYSRLYRNCTPSASEALARLLIEAETTARDIHTRYAE